jgi:Integrase core domain
VKNYNINKTEKRLIEKTVYKYLRRFWQRGKSKNALIGDYENSSGKGKPKEAGEKKRGRPRIHREDPEIGEGVNVSDGDKRIFEIAITKFYHIPGGTRLTTAYDQMIKLFYKENTRYDENGVMKSVLKPTPDIPTMSEFRYWYKGEYKKDVTKIITSRQGAKKFALDYRAITGSSKAEANRPGARFQIDATIADVFLVSKYNRSWIIGRPVIYVVIDVFSRMVVGVYVGLEGPSWIGAMMALANTAADKVAFCKEYAINITPEEWPCHFVPESILGDRAELLGMPVEESFIPNLHVRIENAAAYRADWKGLVERYFSTISGHIEPFVPGYIDVDFRQRGARDYRLDGKLDIDQFIEIVLHIIRFYNNQHFLDTYKRDSALIAADVPCIPVELWRWGIANRSGQLRSFQEDIVKLNLMPRGKATVTAKGIKLKGKEMYYTCERAVKEQWFERARGNYLSAEEKSLNCVYDIRKPNFIYLPGVDGRSFEKCFLIDPEQRYSDKNFHDIEYMLAHEKWQSQRHGGKELQGKVDLIADVEAVVARAEEMSKFSADKGLSDRQRTSGIRYNRANEKEMRRDAEGFELAKTESSQPIAAPSGADLPASKQSESMKPDHSDLLRAKRKERKGEQNPDRPGNSNS